MSYWLNNSTFWPSIFIWWILLSILGFKKGESINILTSAWGQSCCSKPFPFLLRTEVWINLELFFKYQSCLKPLYWGALQCLQDQSILEIAGHLPGCGPMFMFYHGVQQLHKCLTMQLWKQSKNNKIKIIVYISHFLCEAVIYSLNLFSISIAKDTFEHLKTRKPKHWSYRQLSSIPGSLHGRAQLHSWGSTAFSRSTQTPVGGAAQHHTCK